MYVAYNDLLIHSDHCTGKIKVPVVASQLVCSFWKTGRAGNISVHLLTAKSVR